MFTIIPQSRLSFRANPNVWFGFTRAYLWSYDDPISRRLVSRSNSGGSSNLAAPRLDHPNLRPGNPISLRLGSGCPPPVSAYRVSRFPFRPGPFLCPFRFTIAFSSRFPSLQPHRCGSPRHTQSLPMSRWKRSRPLEPLPGRGSGPPPVSTHPSVPLTWCNHNQ